VIVDRVAAVHERIRRAAARVGRAPEDVRLIAVSKNHPADAVRAAFAAGVRDFGENRVQEAEGKIAALADLRAQLRWHLIGHLQSNKARRALSQMDVIESVDSIDLALRLGRLAAERGAPLDILVQVDLAGEIAKTGLPETDLLPLIQRLPRECPHLRVGGLMLMPPYDDDPERVRPYFRRLRELSESARAQGLTLGPELSMGMSHDLETAVEEGATLVRVGTAIFGERRY
jgi:PLP dependent protein